MGGADERTAIKGEKKAMRAMLGRVAAILLLAALVWAPQTAAQSDPRFIRLASKVKGVLYMPDQGPAPHVGIMLMHEDANFLVHLACTEFAKRGYAVLC